MRRMGGGVRAVRRVRGDGDERSEGEERPVRKGWAVGVGGGLADGGKIDELLELVARRRHFLAVHGAGAHRIDDVLDGIGHMIGIEQFVVGDLMQFLDLDLEKIERPGPGRGGEIKGLASDRGGDLAAVGMAGGKADNVVAALGLHPVLDILGDAIALRVDNAANPVPTLVGKGEGEFMRARDGIDVLNQKVGSRRRLAGGTDPR